MYNKVHHFIHKRTPFSTGGKGPPSLHIAQQYIHRHILSMSTRYLNCCRCDIEWMLKVLKRN